MAGRPALPWVEASLLLPSAAERLAAPSAAGVPAVPSAVELPDAPPWEAAKAVGPSGRRPSVAEPPYAELARTHAEAEAPRAPGGSGASPAEAGPRV